MIAPRVYFEPNTSAEERGKVLLALEQPRHRRTGEVWVRLHPAIEAVRYSAKSVRCIDCGGIWSVWARYGSWTITRVGQCPACHPDPDELGRDGRLALARRLVQTDAADTLYVLLDQAQADGRTSEEQWHNPADLAEIDRLRRRLGEDHGMPNQPPRQLAAAILGRLGWPAEDRRPVAYRCSRGCGLVACPTEPPARCPVCYSDLEVL